jgi:hypothetical protein
LYVCACKSVVVNLHGPAPARTPSALGAVIGNLTIKNRIMADYETRPTIGIGVAVKVSSVIGEIIILYE